MSDIKPFLAKFMIYFGFFMVVLYVGLGCFILYPSTLPDIPQNIKFVFGFFFIAYGIFRLVRSLMTLKNNRNNQIQ